MYRFGWGHSAPTACMSRHLLCRTEVNHATFAEFGTCAFDSWWRLVAKWAGRRPNQIGKSAQSGGGWMFQNFQQQLTSHATHRIFSFFGFFSEPCSAPSVLLTDAFDRPEFHCFAAVSLASETPLVYPWKKKGCMNSLIPHPIHQFFSLRSRILEGAIGGSHAFRTNHYCRRTPSGCFHST